MPLLRILSNLIRRADGFLFPRPAPPKQLMAVKESEHCWQGVELHNYAMRSGNVELSTRTTSNTLSWFFDRRLEFEGETMDEVTAFLAGCRYMRDIDQFQRDEWWVHPAEFEQLKKGDCEDHALWAWRVLHERGHDVRLMLGLCRGGGHAWVQIYTEGGQSYIMETTAKRDTLRSLASHYVPQHSFKRLDNGLFKLFGHKPEMIEAAVKKTAAPTPKPLDDPLPVEPLSRPEHWERIDKLIFACRKNEAHRAIREAMQGRGSHTRMFLDRYFLLREQFPESFELDDEAYWADWAV